MLSTMEQITSLLEQCVLYTNPRYNPFSPHPRANTGASPGLKDANLASIGKREDIEGLQVVQTMTNEKINGLSFSIDLNFTLPLPADRFLTRLTTPIARSNNRRIGSWKLKKHYARYSHVDAVNLRRRPKVKVGLRSASTCEKTSSGGPPTTFAFLCLPGEVRDMVYSYTFSDARLYINERPSCRHAFNVNHALRSTCKKIYLESAQALFKSLTVYLLVEESTIPRMSLQSNMVPDTIQTKLESLTVVIPRGSFSDFAGERVLRDLPTLSRLTKLKLIDVAAQNDTWELTGTAIQSECAKMQSRIERSEKDIDHWFHDWSVLRRPGLTIQYEQEMWGMAHEHRACYMGSLTRNRYRTVTITSSSDEQGFKSSHQDLALVEFSKRYEMYQWMEDQGIRTNSGSHTRIVLQRLAYMRYHDSLDHIQEGLATTERKEQEVKPLTCS